MDEEESIEHRAWSMEEKQRVHTKEERRRRVFVKMFDGFNLLILESKDTVYVN